jgi:hypothetical protein
VTRPCADQVNLRASPTEVLFKPLDVAWKAILSILSSDNAIDFEIGTESRSAVACYILLIVVQEARGGRGLNRTTHVIQKMQRAACQARLVG